MLIAFAGDTYGVGKTTAMEILRERLLLRAGITTVQVKFAQPLYDMQNFIYNRANLPLPDTKDRKLLQWLGTEWGREKDPNLWMDIFKNEVNILNQRYPKYFIVNDDVRFDNEAETIKELGGKIIKIRGNSRIPQQGIKNHKSEQGINETYIDFYINNDGGIDKLKASIEQLIERL